ncbi:SapC family protein [Desulfurispira natronophila]|uniref:SapC family protein n=1 Tax=Desulfurispira natronophila TaxID=682562 RepID=A0A7W7Y662_9BACT|nr:SapC family protein [Desulfurispira natronophila]MBB5022828.1 hypothetical protein [Desulfurispira natronophila]
MYQDVRPIDPTTDSTTTVQRYENLLHTGQLHSCILATDEFEHAAKSIPILFMRHPQTKALAAISLLGLQPGRNLCLDHDGNWRAGVYLPAYIRCYPFMFMEKEGKLLPSLDRQASVVSTGKGERLYDDQGNPTPYLQSILGLLQEFHNAQVRTRQFIQHMEKLDVLESMTMDVNAAGEKFRLANFIRISEQKLAKIPEQQQAYLIQSGLYRIIAAHLMSLNNLKHLGTWQAELH